MSYSEEFQTVDLIIDSPADRVETWEHMLYQASPYSPETNSWHMVWSDLTISAEERKALHKRFPNVPY